MLGLLRFVHLPALGAGNRIHSKLTKSRDHFILLLGITAVQSFALPPSPSRLDLLAILPLLFASVLLARTTPSAPNENAQWNLTSTSKGYWSAMSLLPPTWRPHLQTILRTPSSSRIFYFLLLNLAYMGVQMAYGVFTNSLGLISDCKLGLSPFALKLTVASYTHVVRLPRTRSRIVGVGGCHMET
jgi:hypothetical protein